MLAVKSMDVRDKFKLYCDKVYRGETILISRPPNESVVMISLDEFNSLMKAKRNAGYLEMLDKSMAQAENGGLVPKSIDEMKSHSLGCMRS